MTVYVEGGMTSGLAKMHGHGQNAKIIHLVFFILNLVNL